MQEPEVTVVFPLKDSDCMPSYHLNRSHFLKVHFRTYGTKALVLPSLGSRPEALGDTCIDAMK